MGLIDSLEQVINQDGDIADIGCWKGDISFRIAQYLVDKKINKKIYLFDTFEGHLLKDVTEVDKSWGFMSKLEYFHNVSMQNIIDQFNNIGFSNYELVKGDIFETFKTKLDVRYCFASTDLNFYTPTVLAINYLKTTLNEDGLIYEDDYNNIEGITKAYDECDWLQIKEIIGHSGASFVKKPVD